MKVQRYFQGKPSGIPIEAATPQEVQDQVRLGGDWTAIVSAPVAELTKVGAIASKRGTWLLELPDGQMLRCEALSDWRKYQMQLSDAATPLIGSVDRAGNCRNPEEFREALHVLLGHLDTFDTIAVHIYDALQEDE